MQIRYARRQIKGLSSTHGAYQRKQHVTFVKGANLTAVTAIAFWSMLAFLGRAGLGGVVAQRAPGYPNLEQIDFYIVWPLLIIAGLMGLAWLCNAFGRWSNLLALISGASIAVLFPYLIYWSGGM